MNDAPPGETVPSSPGELADVLSSLDKEVQSLVGPDCQRILATHIKGVKLGSPPRVTHRLGEALYQTQRSADSLRAGFANVDLTAISHLFTVREIFRRWESDPEWPSIKGALKDPDSYRHTVCMLAAAGALKDVGNHFSLRMAKGDVRTSDASIELNPGDYVSVEVKSPQTLDTMTQPVSKSQAGTIVKRALASAGSGQGGQLAEGSGGLLILGGLNLSKADFEALRQATEGHLLDKRAPRPMLVGVVLTSVGTVVEGDLLIRDGQLIGGSATALSATLTVLPVENPNYQGSVGLDTSLHPGVSYLEEEVDEFQIGKHPEP